ncbi:hypothetical protein [Flavobacterium granuli]|uniref:Lipoprotein n=1 Tax=Flavobacterium granuli TaxID=280093 RepID=A0ABU1RYV9_9FLAO|nr:hypothetical protein [Flavobacterium granuli]MDR6843941.1 hypothetical protein [Flavobacterium granuli]
MTKQILTLVLLLSLTFISCKKETTESQNKTNTTTVTKDTLSAKLKDSIVDPDPTDTIPAGKYGINSSNLETANIVRLTLQNIYKDDLSKNVIDDYSKRFIFFEYDLNDDGKKEILVGLTGPYFCGSGGCTQYILDNQGAIITKFTVANYPVVIDTDKSSGWKNLFIQSGHKNRIVKFDGKKYPSNPSLQPELKVTPGDDLPRALNFTNEPYAWFKF